MSIGSTDHLPMLQRTVKLPHFSGTQLYYHFKKAKPINCPLCPKEKPMSNPVRTVEIHPGDSVVLRSLPSYGDLQLGRLYPNELKHEYYDHQRTTKIEFHTERPGDKIVFTTDKVDERTVLRVQLDQALNKLVAAEAKAYDLDKKIVDLAKLNADMDKILERERSEHRKTQACLEISRESLKKADATLADIAVRAWGWSKP